MPAGGPQHKDDGINELYLTYPTALGPDGVRYPVGAGLIIPLTEVSYIALGEEPTGSARGQADGDEDISVDLLREGDEDALHASP